MAPRTRSTTTSPVKKTSTTSGTTMVPEHEPVKVLIAPQQISAGARILQLRHPSDGSPRSFLFCPEVGLLELKLTKAPITDPRSIIFAPTNFDAGIEQEVSTGLGHSFASGFISKEAQTLTATPYDFAFILLRLIAPSKLSSSDRTLYQPLEDLLISPETNDKSLKFILEKRRDFVKEAISRITDVVEAGGEEMFRYNEEKVFHLVLQKAQFVAESGLPSSLEERFVARALEAPMLSVKRENATVSVVSQPAVTEDSISQTDVSDSQSSTASSAVSAVFSEASITTTSTVIDLVEDVVPSNVKHLQRIRTAYDFIAASCLPPYVAIRVTPLLKDSAVVNFRPLEEYLDNLAVLRAEAVAARSMADFGHKRGLEDEEIAEMKAEKKRKLEEEEKKRKANESRGVRDLKKVNVTGMKKMSDFFSKKPTTMKATI